MENMAWMGWTLAIAVIVAPVCAEPSMVGPFGVATTAQEEARITNADIVAMVEAGFETATIIAAMRTLEPAFDTSADALIALREAGVHDDVIIEMFLDRPEKTRSRKESVWRIGTFNEGIDDLPPSMEFPPTVRFFIDPDGSHDGHFPDTHFPRDGERNAAHVLNITFHAEAGEYVFSIGQPATREPETVSVLLNGAPLDEFTTVSLVYKLHEIPLRIARTGEHTLTLDSFSGNGGYWIDALELERVVEY